jgi:hypothetical protein
LALIHFYFAKLHFFDPNIPLFQCFLNPLLHHPLKTLEASNHWSGMVQSSI